MLHTSIEALVAVVAFATFAVQWYAAGARLGDARARLVGAAFLGVALIELLHLLAFPGMPGLIWLQSSTERGIVYWLSARAWTVVALIAAAGVRAGSRSWWLRRGPLLTVTVAAVAAVLLADAFWISRQPLFFVEGTGLTPLKKHLEALVAGGALAGMILYVRRYRRAGDRTDRDLSIALGFTVLSELCFALYVRAHDSFNLLGHAYLLLASYATFHALFVAVVIGPYERLAVVSSELTKSNSELERLRRHVEQELEVTISDLRRVQEHREDLLRAVSHDLRTPLQVILLQAERIALSGDPTVARKGAGKIVASGHQMASMIRDLVDLVGLESGRLVVGSQEVELQPFVAELLGVAGGALETDRVKVDIPADVVARCDPARMSRVVQNLVANALKYSAPGSEVVVDARRRDGGVVLSVKDRGSGIVAAEVPHVFDRFYRGVNHRQTDGLGLGLYISRLIVEAHGGRISCHSVVGEGSTFEVSLPGAAAPVEAMIA